MLRRLSLGVARVIDAGDTPAAEAALIKQMGTRFEQAVVRALRELLDRELVLRPGAGTVIVRTVVASRRAGCAVVHDPGRHH